MFTVKMSTYLFILNMEVWKCLEAMQRIKLSRYYLYTKLSVFPAYVETTGMLSFEQILK